MVGLGFRGEFLIGLGYSGEAWLLHITFPKFRRKHNSKTERERGQTGSPGRPRGEELPGRFLSLLVTLSRPGRVPLAPYRPPTFKVTWGHWAGLSWDILCFCSPSITSAHVGSGAVVWGLCGRITGLECPSVFPASHCSHRGRFWYPREGPSAEFLWWRLCQLWSAGVDLIQLGCFVFSLSLVNLRQCVTLKQPTWTGRRTLKYVR